MQAHASGWDTLRLFGVGPQIGTLRGDSCGGLIPLTLDVTEVTSEWIRIGRGREYKAHPVKMPDMILIWEFKR